MTFYDEQTGADVAGFLGVSEANVRVIRHRAIHRLRECMGTRGMSCASPIDAAVLADYWLAALPGPEEEAVEEHLLGCDQCGARLREVIALAEGVRDLARRGFPANGGQRRVISGAPRRTGLRVREYAPPRGGSVQCTVTAEDDILIGRLAADVSGAARVDLCICDEHGVERSRMEDIPVHSAASEHRLPGVRSPS